MSLLWHGHNYACAAANRRAPPAPPVGRVPPLSTMVWFGLLGHCSRSLPVGKRNCCWRGSANKSQCPNSTLMLVCLPACLLVCLNVCLLTDDRSTDRPAPARPPISLNTSFLVLVLFSLKESQSLQYHFFPLESKIRLYRPTNRPTD